MERDDGVVRDDVPCRREDGFVMCQSKGWFGQPMLKLVCVLRSMMSGACYEVINHKCTDDEFREFSTLNYIHHL